MKDLVWDRVLSVDFEEIDQDHRKLVEIFNVLARAVGAGEPREYLEAVLAELVNCTVWHFSHEERLMLKYDYAQMDDHKAAHADLIDSVRQLQRRFVEERQDLAEEEIEFLERWLTGHILHEDMRLGAYLAQVS